MRRCHRLSPAGRHGAGVVMRRAATAWARPAATTPGS